MRVGETIEGWVLSFEFDSFEDAGNAYEQVRNIVFGRDIDGSVYRALVNQRPHVIALGFPDIAEGDKDDLEAAMLGGRDAPLREEILLPLVLRHAKMHVPGMKFERRGAAAPEIKFE